MLFRRFLSALTAVTAALTFAVTSGAASARTPYVTAAFDEQISECDIFLDPAGGTFPTGGTNIESIKAVPGQPFGELVLPVREGYDFLGWFDELGGLVTPETICPNKRTMFFTAGWTLKKVTLTFDPCGGTVTSRTKNYASGKVGALPTARRSGYTFKGWYTRKNGGTRISYETVLKDVKDRTFYAHYAKPTFSTLRFDFSNSYKDFGYKKDFVIPYSTYEEMFGSEYADFVYDEIGRDGWEGNCFGMSAASAFLNTGKQKVQSFNKKEYFIKDLTLGDYSASAEMDVRTFIECLQVAQYSPLIQEKYYDNLNDLSLLVKNVKKCAQGKGQPVVVALMSDYLGHAVVAYKWKKVSDKEERIYVYDCNYPKDSDVYITLYKKNGKYVSSEYEFFEDLTFFDFSDIWKVWKERGTPVDVSLIASGEKNAKIYSADGKLCAKIENGELFSESGGFYTLKKIDGKAVDGVYIAPKGEYTVKTVGTADNA